MFPSTAGQRLALIPEILIQLFEGSIRDDRKRLNVLGALFQLLAPLTTEDGKTVFTRALTGKDWVRFDYYARRVRSLRVAAWSEPSVHPSLITEILSTRGPSELLPNLRCVEFYQCPLDGLRMFLHANITELSIHRWGECPLLGAILSSLPTKAPLIRRISLSEDEYSPQDDDAITTLAEALLGLSSLESLNLPIRWFSSAVLDTAASRTSLTELSTTPWYGDDFDYEQLCTMSLLSNGFPALRALRVDLPFRCAAEFISRVNHFSALTHFDAESSLVEAPQEYGAILTALSKCCPNLENLSLDIVEAQPTTDHHASITYDELSPLAQLTQLQYLSLNHPMPFQLDRDNVIAIARALPNLTDMILNPAPNIVPVSMLGVSVLSPLRDLCPNLVLLGLFLDAADEHIPPPPSSDDEHLRAAPECAEFTNLTSLNVGMSSFSSPIPLAVYLSSILPQGCELMSERDDDGRSEEWEQVHQLIPVFKQVRAQGIRIGRLICSDPPPR